MEFSLIFQLIYISYSGDKINNSNNSSVFFLFQFFHKCQIDSFPRAHQTRRSGRNSCPISAEVALPRLQSEIKVALFLFASHSFLAHNLRFMVRLIDKTDLLSLATILRYYIFFKYTSIVKY